MLDVIGPAEVFGDANRLHGGRPFYEIEIISASDNRTVTSHIGVPFIADYTFAETSGPIDTLLVAGGLGAREMRYSPKFLAWLKEQSKKARRFGSVCTGALILADAGLLDGRHATTHWRFCGELSAAYPRVHVDPGVLYVDEGDVLTSGGVAAGIDLCLHLVRKDHGAEVANDLARRLVVGPHRDGGQAQFIDRPVAGAFDRRLDPALTWALEHLDQNPAVDQLAAIAAMSRRTFYREFHAATGTTPHRWLVAQQIIRARRILETTDLAVAEVAREAGFEDASVFRRHFTGQVGLSPTAYRRTFGRLGDGRRTG